MNIQLIQAGISDLPSIARLADIIWNIHYPSIIGIDQVKYMLARNYSFQALEEQMEQGQKFYLVLMEGKEIGFVSWSIVQSHKAFIHKFYVLPSEHNKGVGERVFQLLMKEMTGINEVSLQVNRQNVVAINFYFKMGMKIKECADFDIGEGYFMNDFIMTIKP